MRSFEKMIKRGSTYSPDTLVEFNLFDSVREHDDFIRDQSNARPDVKHHAAGGAGVQDIGANIRSLDDWESKINETDKDAMAIVEELEKKIDDKELPKPQSRVRRRQFDEYDGDDICYDRLRSGQKFWRTTRRETMAGPATMTLLINVSTSWSIKSKDILWKAAAGLVAAKKLEEAGYRVELWLVNASWNTYDNRSVGGCQAVRLKRPQDPINLASLSTAATGWYYRTSFFASIEASMQGHQATMSLGTPCAITESLVKEITPDPHWEVIECKGEHDALEKIKDILAKVKARQDEIR